MAPYTNFPFGSGNARNKYFWIVVIVILLFILFKFMKKSGYIQTDGRSFNMTNNSQSKKVEYMPIQEVNQDGSEDQINAFGLDTQKDLLSR